MFNSRREKKFGPKASRDKTSSEKKKRRQTLKAIASSTHYNNNNNNNSNNKSSSRRIVLALVTLSSCSSSSLRSILNGFYYAAAIVSLLLLIVYFHQAKAQPQAARMSHEIEFVRSIEGPVRAARQRPVAGGGGTKTAQINSGAIKRPPAPAAARQAASSKRPAPSLELTFRLAGDYSENNRGSQQPTAINETQPMLASSSQWTPILHQKPPRKPAQPFPPPPPPPTVRLPNPAGGSDQVSRSEPPGLPYRPSSDRALSWHDHHHHHHPQQQHQQQQQRDRPDSRHRSSIASESRRNWRQPRLKPHTNGAGAGFRQSKMYKRVLICDKTLVSLDYARDFGAEPRPFPMAHYSFGDPSSVNNFVDDNSIEIDLNPGPGDLLDRRASSTNLGANITGPNPPTASVRATSTTTTSTTTTTTTIPTSASASTATTTTTTPASLMPVDQDISVDSAATMIVDRRSGYQYNMLPDEDALVKCDMWDLEKGLKNRKPPADILDLAVKADFDTVRDAINRCRQLTEKTLPPDDEYRDGLEIMSSEDLVSLFSMKRGLLPGTKWCGLGDQASTYNDLGPKHRIDICCRAHDHCPIRLKPFRNDYGVLNIALYTKSHCDCDADFYRCLREAHSRTADMLGNLYFNVMKLQCIREERLKVCREVRPIALGFERCVRYEENPMMRVFKFTTPPVAY